MADLRPRIAFAGDRDIAVSVLGLLLESGDCPLGLILSDADRASHDRQLVQLCDRAGASPAVIRARDLHTAASLSHLRSLNLDYIVCVHFPYLVKPAVLYSARRGVLNLHPAYLPYNRGWHTPSWAILDGTPAGATLHFMNEAVDAGDILYQEQIAADPGDTAHTLYTKLKALELRVFDEGWRRLREGRVERIPQPDMAATSHRQQALLDPSVQKIEMDRLVRASDLLTRLRALTTNRLDEAAYFESGGVRYRVQVRITPDSMNGGA